MTTQTIKEKTMTLTIKIFNDYIREKGSTESWRLKVLKTKSLKVFSITMKEKA
jgi:hypothetical protein